MSSSGLLKWFSRWNQKLHIYAGMYLLLFAWVFAISGLVLNHSKWSFAEFWSSRKESTTQVPVRMPASGDDLAKVRDMMGQLQLSGEIDRIAPGADKFEFRLGKPGQIVTVTVRPAEGQAEIKRIQMNTWGVLNGLHHLTGQHGDNAALTRNTLAVKFWSLFVDLVCTGMVLLVAGGVWMWYQRKDGRVAGLIALVLGVVCCGFFVFAL